VQASVDIEPKIDPSSGLAITSQQLQAQCGRSAFLAESMANLRRADLSPDSLVGYDENVPR
jgi:hypothetical protein